MGFELKNLASDDIAHINSTVAELAKDGGRAWYLNEAHDLHRRWALDEETGDYLVEGSGGVVDTEDMRAPFNFKFCGGLYQLLVPYFGSPIVVLGSSGASDDELMALKGGLQQAFSVLGFLGNDIDDVFMHMRLETA